jgi:hypothetical protein
MAGDAASDLPSDTVKFLPVVLPPWKRVRIVTPLSAAVVGLLYLLFLNHGRIPSARLAVCGEFSLQWSRFAALDQVAPPQFLAGLVCVK